MDEEENTGMIDLRRKSKLTGIPSMPVQLNMINEEDHDDNLLPQLTTND